MRVVWISVSVLLIFAIESRAFCRSSSCWAVRSCRSSTRRKRYLTGIVRVATVGEESPRNQDPLILEDGKGHINSELAQRLYRWEQNQRIAKDRPTYSTRDGLRWVQQTVAQFKHEYSEDMTQEGVIALMDAMTKFEEDARPSETFEMFAKFKIRRALECFGKGVSDDRQKGALSVESTVEISDPLETHYSHQEEWEAREALLLSDNREHSVKKDLIDDFFDETVQYEGDDQMWVHQQQVAAPLRDSIPESEDDLPFDTDPSPDDRVMADLIRYNTDEFLGSTLDEQESEVIQMIFGLDNEDDSSKTPSQVSSELGLSLSRVRKIQRRALSKLRVMFAERYLGNDEDQLLEDTV